MCRAPPEVARSTRAWIETGGDLNANRYVMESHALRVRGLKPAHTLLFRGLDGVARSTRAWIETKNGYKPIGDILVARSTRAWIETSLY